MGKDRDLMESNLRLSRYKDPTQREYLRHAKLFVKHFMKPAAEIDGQEVRQYLHHLIDEEEASVSKQKMAFAGIKFLYEKTLYLPEVVANIPWPKVDHRLPSILSFAELDALFAAAPTIRLRTAFLLGYGAGLRLNEIRLLKVGDIDSERGVLHVFGKGSKERLTLLTERLLEALREYWRTVRPPGPLLFPGGSPDGAMSRTTLQSGFRKSAKTAGIRKRVSLHTLRHNFATMLFEAGTDSRVIQELLGHRSAQTTARYLKVRADFIRRVVCPLQLMEEHLKKS